MDPFRMVRDASACDRRGVSFLSIPSISCQFPGRASLEVSILAPNEPVPTLNIKHQTSPTMSELAHTVSQAQTNQRSARNITAGKIRALVTTSQSSMKRRNMSKDSSNNTTEAPKE
jgi:hypothetical protein